MASEVDPEDLQPSEFGGGRGMVHPTPHEPTASERLMLMKHTGQDPDAIVDQQARGSGRAFRGDGVELRPGRVDRG